MIWNLGSINVDHIYAVPHMPEPRETLTSTALGFGLDGKGANQSVAAASGIKVTRAGAADGIPTKTEVQAFLADRSD
ncbi:MAG: hypothetical protein ACRCSU_00550 [Paracoccaceae bacterium]